MRRRRAWGELGDECRVGAVRIDLGARRLKGERRGRVQGKVGGYRVGGDGVENLWCGEKYGVGACLMTRAPR